MSSLNPITIRQNVETYIQELSRVYPEDSATVPPSYTITVDELRNRFDELTSDDIRHIVSEYELPYDIHPVEFRREPYHLFDRYDQEVYIVIAYLTGWFTSQDTARLTVLADRLRRNHPDSGDINELYQLVVRLSRHINYPSVVPKH